MDKELRTDVRSRLYNSDWDITSVIGQCQEKGVPADKVAIAIAKCHRLIKGFSKERIGGALAVIFNLADVPNEHI